MTFFLVYLAILIVPGALLSVSLGLNMEKPGMSVALSITVFVAVLFFVRLLKLDSTGFHIFLATIYALLVAGAIWRWRKGRPDVTVPAFAVDTCLIPLLTSICVAVYAAWAGPYTEVPADAWWHLGRINHHLKELSAGSIGTFDDFPEMVDKFAGYWYMLPALVLNLTNTGIQAALPYLAFGNVLVFTTAVYSFALFVFKDLCPTPRLRHLTAASTVFFFMTQFGISVFSYPRYYVFAPTLPNFVVYMSAITCFIQFTGRESGGYKHILIVLLLLATAFLVHMQEALYILVMAGMILLAETFTVSWHSDKKASRGKLTGFGNTRALVLLVVFGVVYLICHAVAYSTLTRSDPLAHGLIADIRHYLPFLQNLFVLKPTYQFFQVLTLWGVFVFVLFIFYRKQLSLSPFLFGGMALPVFTVFNPVFTDLFLRLAPSEVLWRVCFLLPLPFVGAYVFVENTRKVVHEDRLVYKCLALFISLTLVVLLLPFETKYLVSEYSKIDTVTPVNADNDHRLWRDLIEELNTLEPGKVITDPVTGYVLRALTKHRYKGYKFYGFGAMEVSKNRYGNSDFEGKAGWLVVINKRDGSLSETGRHSGHWPETIMKISRNYSTAFVEYVDSHPDIFTKIWERDDMAIYRIERI